MSKMLLEVSARRYKAQGATEKQSDGKHAWTDNHIRPAATRTTAMSGPAAHDSLQVGHVTALPLTDLQHASL